MIEGSRTPIQREIAEAVDSSRSTTGIESRMENRGRFIAEVSDILAKVASDKQIELYPGHEKNGNYLTDLEFPPGHHPTSIGNSMAGPEAIRYTPKTSSSQYKPSGCSDGNCYQ
jgi:hypothetical protein